MLEVALVMAVLRHTAAGRVLYRPATDTVHVRTRDGVEDVTPVFVAAMRAGWVLISPYDPNVPEQVVQCLVTRLGEDKLIEAAAKRRERKAARK